MKDQIKYLVAAGLLMLFLPLGLTAVISGREAISIQKQWDPESCLPMILCREIPWEYEEETLKAQAVLARSSLYLRLKEEKPEEILQSILKEEMEEYQKNFGKKKYRDAYKRMEKAVKSTHGEVMTYQGEVCRGVFHQISAGNTRDGREVLQKTEMTYLKSVDSRQDLQSENYLRGHYFTEEALRQRLKEAYPEAEISDAPLLEQIQITMRDGQEYVLELSVGNLPVIGEEFREKLELSSSNFTIQEVGGKIRFLCKGRGHGLGMSQYGANQLALQGKTYREILFFYFPEVELNTFYHSGNPIDRESRNS